MTVVIHTRDGRTLRNDELTPAGTRRLVKYDDVFIGRENWVGSETLFWVPAREIIEWFDPNEKPA